MSRRILHVSQPVDGGVATVVRDYLSALQAAGDEVALACPAPSALAESVAEQGISVLPWSATRSPGPSVVGESRSLAHLISQWQPDVVHLHSAKAGLAGRLALRGTTPVIFQPHAWSFAAVHGAMRAASLAWERLAGRWSDAVICVSEAERSAAPSDRLRARSVVIPNRVDPGAWVPADRSSARTSLRCDRDAPLVVCVGRLCEQKGQDTLLELWPTVVSAVPDARLVLIGDGPAAASLRQLAPPGVHFAGAAQVADWYAAADVVVVPSRWEAMAMVPLEAQAAGRLVIAFDVDGIRESLDAANTVVPRGDSQGFAAALVAALKDLRTTHQRGLRGRDTTLRAWSGPDHVTRLHDLYDEVCGRSRNDLPNSPNAPQEAHS